MLLPLLLALTGYYPVIIALTGLEVAYHLVLYRQDCCLMMVGLSPSTQFSHMAPSNEWTGHGN